MKNDVILVLVVITALAFDFTIDYIPLFALLGSQLTNDEVNTIAEELTKESDPGSAEAIKHAIAAVTDHREPKDSDVARVRARLAR